jgi:hypothetical protein
MMEIAILIVLARIGERMNKMRTLPFRRVLPLFLSLLLATSLLAVAIIPGHAFATPLISIASINKDVSVTISGVNFPAGKVFTVRMGAYGTLGIGGTIVGTYDSSAGSSFTQTYTIPSGLVGAYRIAIRLDSTDGFYSYNWFVNDASASPSTPVPAVLSGYHGYPTFDISAVSSGSSVTVLTHNMPAGQAFTVRMGAYGTLGIGGTVVGTTSDSGGSYSTTFAIPAGLASNSKIAIRMDGPTGLYAFNWFYNNTTSSAATPVPYATALPGPTPVPGYYGYPSFYINSVVKDSKVTISAYNFPPGQTFNVRMGAYGTLGIGGTLVTSVDTGSGGNFSATYDIPAALAGSSKIAIRLETGNGYYYAFNWFYNNSTY